MRENDTLTEQKIESYIELLVDISPDLLEQALIRTARTAEWFPSVAEIRRNVTEQYTAEDSMKSEAAWDTVMLIFRHNFHPDIGLYGDPPKLDEAAEWALRQIGDLKGIARSNVENESFLRKDFITAYKRYRETGGYLAPTREQASKLLNQLRKGEIPE